MEEQKEPCFSEYKKGRKAGEEEASMTSMTLIIMALVLSFIIGSGKAIVILLVILVILACRSAIVAYLMKEGFYGDNDNPSDVIVAIVCMRAWRRNQSHTK